MRFIITAHRALLGNGVEASPLQLNGQNFYTPCVSCNSSDGVHSNIAIRGYAYALGISA
ncbi:hypothetical protein [Thermococcus sp.]